MTCLHEFLFDSLASIPEIFIRIGNQMVSQSKICFLKVLVNHKMVPFYWLTKSKLDLRFKRTAKIQVILNQSIPEKSTTKSYRFSC